MSAITRSALPMLMRRHAMPRGIASGCADVHHTNVTTGARVRRGSRGKRPRCEKKECRILAARLSRSEKSRREEQQKTRGGVVN